MIYVPLAPEGVLAEALDAMFYIQGYAPEHNIERLTPDGKLAVVIELDGQERFVHDNDSLKPKQSCKNTWLSGMHTGFISISALDNTTLLAIQFKPGKAYPFIKQPLDSFKDKVVPAVTVFGDTILALRKQLLSLPDPQQKLDTTASWLMNQYDVNLLPNEQVEAVLNQIITTPTLPTVKHALEQHSYSKKHFLHLFKKHVGLSPKALQRILRFSEVLQLIQAEEQVQWAQISVECGYYDQSHFIKDFVHFSGYNPKEFLDEDHDRPNFFPVDEPDM